MSTLLFFMLFAPQFSIEVERINENKLVISRIVAVTHFIIHQTFINFPPLIEEEEEEEDDDDKYAITEEERKELERIFKTRRE